MMEKALLGLAGFAMSLGTVTLQFQNGVPPTIGKSRGKFRAVRANIGRSLVTNSVRRQRGTKQRSFLPAALI
jgi:hypothetical protein